MLSSLKNPLVKEILHLRERRSRERLGQFLVEGYRELERAEKGAFPIKKILFSPPLFLGANEEKLLAAYKNKGTSLLEVSEKVFRHFSYRDRPDGLLGVAKKIPLPLEALSLSKNPFLVVACSIEKPGNLGTILRSSDAAGADGLIVCDKCTDLMNPNVVRASTGTLFTVPIAEATSAELVAYLRAHKITIVASTPSAKTIFTKANFRGPIAILVGSEQYGLSDDWLKIADCKVKIPMHGVADSLNVATATTLLAFEAVRQRAI